MFNKLSAAMPDFDINDISQKIKQSITEPDPKAIEPRLTPSCELIEVRTGKLPAIVIINGFMSEKEESAEAMKEASDAMADKMMELGRKMHEAGHDAEAAKAEQDADAKGEPEIVEAEEPAEDKKEEKKKKKGDK